ncbi:hypothetical protein ACTVJ2_02905 [Serratia nevei]|uniref:hypothetical protein n=1 Tax=Serratia nevei TaxID=2703794 RepID=UPI003FA6DB28
MINRILFVLLAITSVSGCVQESTEQRVAKAKEKYAAEAGEGYRAPSAEKGNINPMLRLECSTKAGTRISALMNGTSQTVTISGAVFYFINRVDTADRGEGLVFGRKANGEASVIFIQMDRGPSLDIYSQGGSLKFACKAYRE